MRSLNEAERIAARAIAKGLIKRIQNEPWYRLKNETQCAIEISKAVNQAANQHGIPALWLKSMVLRISRGDV